jgi:hypothetical protein
MNWRCGASDRVPSCKCEALSSNPSPTKTKEEEEFMGWRKGAEIQSKSRGNLFNETTAKIFPTRFNDIDTLHRGFFF